MIAFGLDLNQQSESEVAHTSPYQLFLSNRYLETARMYTETALRRLYPLYKPRAEPNYPGMKSLQAPMTLPMTAKPSVPQQIVLSSRAHSNWIHGGFP